MEIYTVKGLNEYIQKLFKGDMGLSNVAVQGEISKCTHHSDGNDYFTIKDDFSALDCTLFNNYKRYMNFTLEAGMKVTVYGYISGIVKMGKYSLTVRKAEMAGEGEIAARLEQLKKKFKEQGLFDEKYKKPLPKYPKKIGIVTSPTGDAIWDCINTARERNPYVTLILYPALVQGDKAKDSIARGIKALEKYGVDVIAVGRGGGSLEDLWPFNEEVVARAIFDCSVPIISAVGHETDFMVSDLVADMRANAPTKAMVMAIPEIAAIDEKISKYQNNYVNHINNVIQLNRLRTEQFKGEMEKKSPKAKLLEYKSRSGICKDRLEHCMKQCILSSRHSLNLYTQRLKQINITAEPKHVLNLYTERLKKINLTAEPRHRLKLYEERLKGIRITDEAKHKLKLYVERMKQANPLERLSQGLAYVSDENDKRISAVSELSVGQILNVRLKDGKVRSKVEEIIPIKEEA